MLSERHIKLLSCYNNLTMLLEQDICCPNDILSCSDEILSCYNNLIMLFEQDIILSERHKLFGRDIKLL